MKVKALTFAAIAAAVVLTSACQKKEEKIKYSYSENGCTTSHEFDSKDAYCSALLDEKFNDGCARGMRIQSWEANCR